ncbi:MAG: hypothetical protein K8T89_25925 [Planctomycetes bacterium]|nr:hypothetical protein [Planctomycetota bacterium]
MATPTSDRQRQAFLFFLLALLPAGNALNPCLDVDTWWHLRVGQTIVETHQIPVTDPFSQLGREERVPWIAYSWLYELLLFGAYQAGGFAGIMVCRHLFDLLSFASIAWVLLRHARSSWVGLGVLALVTVSLLPFTPERPWHITIFLTALTLHAVLRLREGASLGRFWGLPILYILWANVHIQFVMGFAVLGMAWAVTMVEWLRSRDEAKWMQMRGIFILGACCTLATLVTPFHVRLYLVIWEYATQTAALRLVSELQPPVFSNWWNWPLVVLLLLAAFAIVRQGYPLWDLVLLISALFFSLRMQRDLWYGVLASGTVIVRGLQIPSKEDVKWSAWRVVGISLVALIFMRGVWELVQSTGMMRRDSFAIAHDEAFPVGAVDFVKANRPPGPLYNNFDWGGYLIWTLADYPVSIDGRTNLYGEKRLEHSMDTWLALAGWEEDIESQKAKVIIAPMKRKDKEQPLTDLLRNHPKWKIAYEDKTAVVFVRVP